MTESEELQFYRQLNAKALADPKARELLFQLRKTINPEASFPEVDIPTKLRSEMETELKKRDSEIAAFKKEAAEKEFIADYNRRKEALKGAPYYLDDKDIPLVEKSIEEKGFPSLELAADYYTKVTEPIKPSGLGMLGLSQTRGSLEERKDFNSRYQGIFKKRSNKGREVLSQALEKVRSGEYLNEMR